MKKFECISVQQALACLAGGQGRLVDIRDQSSFVRGHACGAFHLTRDSLHTFMQQTDMDASVLVMCYHGISSQRMAQSLLSLGFERVYSIDGGFDAWQAAFPQQVTITVG